MGAVAVLYTLTTGGDLKQDLPGLAAGLDKLKASAQAAQDKVKELGTAGRERLNAFGEGALGAAEGAGALLEGVTALIEGLHGLLEANKDYEQSITRLGNELGTLKDRIADAIGPSVASFVDSFTIGLVYLGNLAGGTLVAAFGTLSEMVGQFVEIAATGLEFWEKIGQGDFSGAKDVLSKQRSNMEGLVDTLKGGWEEVQAANQKALDLAKEAWQKQIDGVKDLSREAQKAAREAASAAFADTPGGQVTLALERVRKGGAGTAIGDVIPESIPDLEEEFFGRLFEEWLNTPAKKLEEAAEQMAESAGRVGTSVEQMAGGFATGFQALGTGSVSGALGAAGVADPVTTAVMAVLDLLKSPEPIFDLFGQVLDTYVNLDDWIVNLAQGVADGVISALPELIAGFVTIGPAVAVALVESAPILFASLIEALKELPYAFAQAFLDVLPNFGGLQDKVGDLFGVGGPLSTHVDRAGIRILGLKIPTFHDGGVMPHDGLANLQAGERVLSRQETRAYNTHMGGLTINLNGVQDVTRLLDEIRTVLGPYGLGLSLTPRAG